MKPNPEIRVRFAPSPTGNLHVGSAHTTLFNWLFARHSGGKFILRVEDTDRERSKPEYEKSIIDGLRWLGLNWDEGPDIGGPYGPYRQTERLDIYEKYLHVLLEKDLAYYCTCTNDELEAERKKALERGVAPKYSGKCRAKNAKTGPGVIRFKVPEKELAFTDIIRGKLSFDGALIGDIVIAKGLREPLYNFAVVVDDAEMKISHVIRGEEHIANTPRQLAIMEALDFPRPQYAHLPLMLDTQRAKLSKRAGTTALDGYRAAGYLPEALINFLALMGWHPRTHFKSTPEPRCEECARDARRAKDAVAPALQQRQATPQLAHTPATRRDTAACPHRGVATPSEYPADTPSVVTPSAAGQLAPIAARRTFEMGSGNEEKLSLKQIIDEFSLERVQKAGAVFDLEKLAWLNGLYIRELPENTLAARLDELFPEFSAYQERLGAEKLRALITLTKERVQTLGDFIKNAEVFLEPDAYEAPLLVWKKSTATGARECLTAARDILASLSESAFKIPDLQAALAPLAETKGRGDVLWPLRVALSGAEASPGPFEIMSIVGREETLRRVDAAIQKL